MPIPTVIRDAVVNAYYPRVLSSPDTARGRAQAGYAIASALAAALVAGGALANVKQWPFPVQRPGVVALALWVLAALLYMRAVAAPVRITAATQRSAEDFVLAALQNAGLERDHVDARQRTAHLGAASAAAATVITVIAAVFLATAGVSHAVSLSWSDQEGKSKLAVDVQMDNLPRDATTETRLLAAASASAEAVLFQERSLATAGGQLSVSAELTPPVRPASVTLVCIVRQGEDVLDERTLRMGPA